MNTKLDTFQGDDLSDLLDGRQVIANKPAPVLPESYKPQEHFEPCRKCGGSGVYRGFGRCFACQGKGGKKFKTSPEQRARARASEAVRQQRKANEALESFKAEHPKVWAWMDGSTFDFAVSLRGSLERFGSLTDNQIAAAYRAIERLEIAKAAREAQIEAAPAADSAGVDRLSAAFDKARAYAQAKAKGLTIRNPKIFIGDIVISPARAGSKNEGALYVKGGREFEAPYFGKIAGGKFFASRECSPDQQAKVLAFIADPKAAAEAHGQETGICCVCGAELKSEWRLRGIGPVCAEKFGW